MPKSCKKEDVVRTLHVEKNLESRVCKNHLKQTVPAMLKAQIKSASGETPLKIIMPRQISFTMKDFFCDHARLNDRVREVAKSLGWDVEVTLGNGNYYNTYELS